MTNIKFSRSLLATCASSILLAACGGGGGASNNVAMITGTSTGAVTGSATTVTGILNVIDADSGQSTFAQPSTLTGTYGVWTVTISGSTATWRYTLDASKAPSTASNDVLSLNSVDGSATQTVTVTIGAGAGSGSGLVSTVSDAVYSGAYASEKVAVFNRLNDDRSKCGFGKLAQNSKLDLAAQNHADYHALNKLENTHYETQGLPGYTGYEAGARITQAGYAYSYGSEDLAQTTWGSWYAGSINHSLVETSATATLKRLYASIYHMAGLMNRTTEVGLGISTFSYNNDGSSNAKTLNMNLAVPASNSTGQLLASSAIASFPCEGVTGLHPAFFGENPDPFPNVNRDVNPYGQPIYVTSGPNTTITLTLGTVTLRGGVAVPTTTLTSSNDPQSRLQSNQVFLVPTVRLMDNSTYDVSLTGTNSGLISSSNPTGTWSKSFSFTTGTVLSE